MLRPNEIEKRRGEDNVDKAQFLKNAIKFKAKHSMAQDAIAFFEKASDSFLSWCLIIVGFVLAIYWGTYGAWDAATLFGAAGIYGGYKLIRAKREKR